MPGSTVRSLGDVDANDVSRRLKAARWLAGNEDEKGRVAPLTPEELAQRDELVENGITANAISEFERKIRPARPMELRAIATALELPPDWFTGDGGGTSPSLTDAFRELEDLRGLLGDLHGTVVEQADRVANLKIEVLARIYERLDNIDKRLAHLPARVATLEDQVETVLDIAIGRVGADLGDAAERQGDGEDRTDAPGKGRSGPRPGVEGR